MKDEKLKGKIKRKEKTLKRLLFEKKVYETELSLLKKQEQNEVSAEREIREEIFVGEEEKTSNHLETKMFFFINLFLICFRKQDWKDRITPMKDFFDEILRVEDSPIQPALKKKAANALRSLNSLFGIDEAQEDSLNEADKRNLEGVKRD